MWFSQFFRAAAGAASASSMTFTRARAVLSLQKSPSQEEVKRAFRVQAMKWHPDRNPSEQAKAKFQEARQAYEVALRHTASAPSGSSRASGAGSGGSTSSSSSSSKASNTSGRSTAEEEFRARARGFGFDFDWEHRRARQDEAPPRKGTKERGAGVLKRAKDKDARKERRERRQARLRTRMERIRGSLAKGNEAIEEEASKIGLFPGAVLFTSDDFSEAQPSSPSHPKATPSAHLALLLTRVAPTAVRGVPLAGKFDASAQGGAPHFAHATFGIGSVLLHNQACFALVGRSLYDGFELFLEEKLSPSAAQRLEAHVTDAGGLAFGQHGYVEWGAKALLSLVKSGTWRVSHNWRPTDLEWCLKKAAQYRQSGLEHIETADRLADAIWKRARKRAALGKGKSGSRDSSDSKT